MHFYSASVFLEWLEEGTVEIMVWASLLKLLPVDLN